MGVSGFFTHHAVQSRLPPSCAQAHDIDPAAPTAIVGLALAEVELRHDDVARRLALSLGESKLNLCNQLQKDVEFILRETAGSREL